MTQIEPTRQHQPHLSDSIGFGCLLMLAIPFVAFGTIPFIMATRVVLQSFRALSWQEVPAFIQDANLDVSTETRGSRTYRARASYTYTFNGATFVGSTVSFSSGSDNIGSFHKDIYRQLSQYRGGLAPFRCYVNPDDPRESVLYRDARTGEVLFLSLFSLLFGGIGYGFLAAALLARHRSKAEGALRQRYPDKPWLHRPDWREKRVTSGATKSLFVTGVVTAICAVSSTPVIALIPAEIRRGEGLTLVFCLLFAIATLTALACFAYSLSRWRRFGRTTLTLTTVPIIPGDHLRGTITSPSPLHQARTVTVTLECHRTVTQQRGKKTSFHFDSLWKQEEVASIQRGAGGASVIPIAMKIPADLPSYGRSNSETTIKWTLTANAQIPGVDFFASYEVPVFDPGKSAP